MFNSDYYSQLLRYDNFEQFTLDVKDAKWNKFKWKGLTLMKDPFTFTTYQQFLCDKKPKTILEFGTWDGGSALWMSDLYKTMEEDVKILTFDINEERVSSLIKSHPNIEFIKLDAYLIKFYVENNLEYLKQLPKPIMVIEDCHENIKEILEQCDRFLDDGDYLIVEDTLYKPKHDIMEEFALENPQYSVDEFYCNFWSHNCSWNVNSYLRKTGNKL